MESQHEYFYSYFYCIVYTDNGDCLFNYVLTSLSLNFIHYTTKCMTVSISWYFHNISKGNVIFNHVKGVLHTNLKLACFVCYLKIINICLKNIYTSQSQLSKELKNGILVGQAVF